MGDNQQKIHFVLKLKYDYPKLVLRLLISALKCQITAFDHKTKLFLFIHAAL